MDLIRKTDWDMALQLKASVAAGLAAVNEVEPREAVVAAVQEASHE